MIKLKQILLENYDFEVEPFTTMDDRDDTTEGYRLYMNNEWVATFSRDDNEASNENYFYIQYFEIDDEFRGKGLIFVIFDAIKRYIRKEFKWAKGIELDADASSGISNKQQLTQMYKGLGFKQTEKGTLLYLFS